MTIAWQESGSIITRTTPLSALKKAVRLTKGQKIAYITDIRYTPHNIEKIVQFAENSDLLFIETPFCRKIMKKQQKRTFNYGASRCDRPKHSCQASDSFPLFAGTPCTS